MVVWMDVSVAVFVMVDGSSLDCFNNTHLGTSDAASERRPPHHRIVLTSIWIKMRGQGQFKTINRLLPKILRMPMAGSFPAKQICNSMTVFLIARVSHFIA
jgi:hypothetical protein